MIVLLDHRYSAGKMRMNRSNITLSNKIKLSGHGETKDLRKYHNLLRVWWRFLTNILSFYLHKVFYHITRSYISHPLIFPGMFSFFGSSCTGLLVLQTSVGFFVISISNSSFAALILFGALNSRTCKPAFPWDCSPSINRWSSVLATSPWWVNETVWNDGTAHGILRQCATQ